MPLTVKVMKNALPGLPAAARSQAGQVSQRSAGRVVDRAKQLVSVASGETRDHIEAVKTGPFTWVVQSTRPSTDDQFDVPSYLEYKVRSYLRAALEEERPVFLDDLDRVIERFV